ncbi:MAG: pitrilysin family protein [Candidatus Eisenbacteria bacterium]|nr:pitrilysin family protein [Candidatus Eisenbacteria bacterium]
MSPLRNHVRREAGERPATLAWPVVIPALCLCLAFLAAVLPVEAADPPPASGAAPAGGRGSLQPVASVEGIEEYQLGNGLRVLLFPDPTKETITVNVTYLVGSRNENYGETGMAHLLEHLMFKGSTKHTDIAAELTSHGCRPNGSTWLDRTNYFETFAASDENLVWALDMEADRMVNSFIAKKDLDSEMTVVRNEFEVGENEPESILEERVTSTAYLWHNYGKSTIGARSDIENVPIDRLQAFYRTWYQPDNAILVVSGKFDKEKTLGLVQQKFGAIPKPDRTLPVTYTTEPAQDGERTVTLRRVGETQAACVSYHIPAGAHPDFVALEALAIVLGDTPSGRLYKALVETKKATSVSARAEQFRDPCLLTITARIPAGQSAEQVRDEIIDVAENWSVAPSEEEVARAREQMIRGWEMAMRNSQWAAIGLSEWAAMGDWRLMFLHRDRTKQVTAADVARVAKTYLVRNNRTSGVFLPTKEPQRVEIPATPDIAEMVAGYKGGEALAQGEEFEATVANIESRTIRQTLPSGAKLVLLPKKTRGQTVQASISFHFGDEQSVKGLRTVGDFAADMLMRGTKKHTRQEISDLTDKLQTRLFVYGGAQGVSGGFETTRENLTEVLRLLAEVMREPSYPATEVDQMKQERIHDLEESKTDPRSLAQVALMRHLSKWPADDVRYTPTPDEEIASTQAVTAEQLAKFHDDYYGSSNGEIAVVGDFDPKEVTALVTELFGDWKSPKPYTRVAQKVFDVEPINQAIEVPDKESAVFSASMPFELRDEDADYPALVLGNYMTGGGFLHSRLATRIRQKEGLSYGVGAWFFADHFDPYANFGAYAIYAPQNDQRLQQAFQEEMTSIVAKGFTPEEVEEAKSGWLQQRKVSRSNDRELAGTLQNREYEGRTLAWDEQLEKKVAALTPEEIHAAMKRHYDPARISIVRAGSFSKAEQPPQRSEAVPKN